MIDQLVLHDLTRQQLQRFVAKPSHAVLLIGPRGMGKGTVAQALAAELLQLEISQLANYPYQMVVAPTEKSISIETIRNLRSFMRLKTTGDKTLRRLVVVEQAEALTTEAQNAFLKLLEEPPADTVVVMTTANPKGLLPTILSRVQSLTLKTPPEAKLRQLATGQSQTVVDRAYLLSDGLPGLFKALISEDAEHPLAASIAEAKSLLSKPAFDRLVAVDGLSKDKDACLSLVEALERTARAGLQAQSTKSDPSRVKQWHRIRKAAHQAREALAANASAKLTLTNLMLNLS